MIFLDDLRTFCLAFGGTTESLPFDANTLVFKVSGKIFLITNIDDYQSISVKCHPDLAQNLRQKHPDTVQPGYHLNKQHWNTITINGTLNHDEILHWVRHSYDLVRASLPKSARTALA